VLAQASEGRDYAVRNAAVEALRLIKEAEQASPASRSEVRLTDAEEGQFRQAMKDLRVRGWFESTLGLGWERRIEAANTLGKLKDPRAVPVLSKALSEDSVPHVRAAAALALGSIGGADVIPALRQALIGENEMVGMAAAKVLKSINDASALEDISRSEVRGNDITVDDSWRAVLLRQTVVLERRLKKDPKNEEARRELTAVRRELIMMTELEDAFGPESAFARSEARRISQVLTEADKLLAQGMKKEALALLEKANQTLRAAFVLDPAKSMFKEGLAPDAELRKFAGDIDRIAQLERDPQYCLDQIEIIKLLLKYSLVDEAKTVARRVHVARYSITAFSLIYDFTKKPTVMQRADIRTV